jgi:hypothetical protein
MKRVLALVVLGLLAGGCKANGIGQVAEITVIDRDSGVTLPVTAYRGEYWVAGRPGARYAIGIANRCPGRVMAVTSVDGLNVLSGATAAWDQNGYVFDSAQRYEISGWRKSDSQVAAFVFTASPNSYAERTGRPANVGVIGVAIFREQPQQLKIAENRREQFLEQPAADAAGAGQLANRAAPVASAAPAAKLGTGHGEREYSYVDRTEFIRAQTQPNEIIRIHYDSTENLVAMGVIRRPRLALPYANPFPGSPDSSYVPDPPG